MRKSDTKGIQVAASRDGRRTSISVDAVNDLGQFINNSEVEVTLIDPSLRREKSLLKQTAPGRYATDIPTAMPGAYNMEIALKKDGQVLHRQSRGLMVGYSDELRIQPTNETLLQQIAGASGGLFNPAPAKVFHRPNVWTTRPTPLWPTLLTLAAVLLVLDVALRRIDFALHWPTWKSRS